MRAGDGAAGSGGSVELGQPEGGARVLPGAGRQDLLPAENITTTRGSQVLYRM